MSNILTFHYEPTRSRYTRYRLDPVFDRTPDGAVIGRVACWWAKLRTRIDRHKGRREIGRVARLDFFSRSADHSSPVQLGRRHGHCGLAAELGPR